MMTATSPTEPDDDPVNPLHYASMGNYSAVHVINKWGVNYNLGQTIKYIQRAGRKPGAPLLQDLEKARWYLDFEISQHAKDER